MPRVPEHIYKNIEENIPIVIVDLIIVRNYPDNPEVLLVQRSEEPEKGQFFPVGGGIYKNEKIRDAIIRKANEETGINVELIKPIISKDLQVYEAMFEKSHFEDIKTGLHTINIAFLVKVVSNPSNIKLDNKSSSYKWVKSPDEEMHPYSKNLIIDSEIFNFTHHSGL